MAKGEVLPELAAGIDGAATREPRPWAAVSQDMRFQASRRSVIAYPTDESEIVQRHGAHVDVPAGHRLRQLLRAEAEAIEKVPFTANRLAPNPSRTVLGSRRGGFRRNENSLTEVRLRRPPRSPRVSSMKPSIVVHGGFPMIYRSRCGRSPLSAPRYRGGFSFVGSSPVARCRVYEIFKSLQILQFRISPNLETTIDRFQILQRVYLIFCKFTIDGLDDKIAYDSFDALVGGRLSGGGPRSQKR